MIETFRRTEKKFILTEEQYKKLLDKIRDRIYKDPYYKSTICNIYFDTDNYDLIINSIEKPIYKEKVRLRSYNVPTLNDEVFLEIKKKYKGVVGKRRITLKLKDFYNYIEKGIIPNCNSQIMNEIDYCFKNYKLKPVMFLAYDRLSYYDKDDKNFRITIDQNIRSRENNLKLEKGDKGDLYFKDNVYIMEAKALNSYPLWFIKTLSELKIYSTSFSKYGNIYSKKIGDGNYV
ncbi:MAG: polyphosphate polymerase domain-containing protein [Bacilli bacterium]|nr:polyphosphate polymerase domain-containing protein [Bacilli bacterium]